MGLSMYLSLVVVEAGEWRQKIEKLDACVRMVKLDSQFDLGRSTEDDYWIYLEEL